MLANADVGDVTAGVLGPHARAAAQFCSKQRKVCGTWEPIDTLGAYIYAKEFHAKPYKYFFYYEEDDCTNYVSQLLWAGGMLYIQVIREESP